MKTGKLLLTAMALSLLLSITAFAGEWKQDTNGWWYQNTDGTYTVSGWQWIDGNNDGIAECYYFDTSGYCLTNATTPDGCTVDGSGAWTVNGVVQTKTFAATEAGFVSNNSIESDNNTAGNQTFTDASATATESENKTEANVWISATGSKYHNKPNCGRMNPNKAYQMPLSEAIEHGYSPCSKCY